MEDINSNSSQLNLSRKSSKFKVSKKNDLDYEIYSTKDFQSLGKGKINFLDIRSLSY